MSVFDKAERTMRPAVLGTHSVIAAAMTRFSDSELIFDAAETTYTINSADESPDDYTRGVIAGVLGMYPMALGLIPILLLDFALPTVSESAAVEVRLAPVIAIGVIGLLSLFYIGAAVDVAMDELEVIA